MLGDGVGISRKPSRPEPAEAVVLLVSVVAWRDFGVFQLKRFANKLPLGAMAASSDGFADGLGDEDIGEGVEAAEDGYFSIQRELRL